MREACGWSCPQKKKEGRGSSKEKRTVHEDDEYGMMSWPCEDKVLTGPTPTAFAGHVVTVTRRA